MGKYIFSISCSIVHTWNKDGNCTKHPWLRSPTCGKPLWYIPFHEFLSVTGGMVDEYPYRYAGEPLLGVSILMAQRTSGPFRLELSWIKAICMERIKATARYNPNTPISYYRDRGRPRGPQNLWGDDDYELPRNNTEPPRNGDEPPYDNEPPRNDDEPPRHESFGKGKSGG